MSQKPNNRVIFLVAGIILFSSHAASSLDGPSQLSFILDEQSAHTPSDAEICSGKKTRKQLFENLANQLKKTLDQNAQTSVALLTAAQNTAVIQSQLLETANKLIDQEYETADYDDLINAQNILESTERELRRQEVTAKQASLRPLVKALNSNSILGLPETRKSE